MVPLTEMTSYRFHLEAQSQRLGRLVKQLNTLELEQAKLETRYYLGISITLLDLGLELLEQQQVPESVSGV